MRALARDGLGRIWFAGSGLWVEEKGGIRAIASVPIADGERVPDMIADPSHPHGVVIALGERGVARVRAVVQ